MWYSKYINPDEQVLAIKISLFVLLGLFLCFFFLVSLNGWYLFILERNNFGADLENFKEILKNEANGNFPLLSTDNILLKSETKALAQRLTKDIIILHKDKKTETKWFFEDIDNVADQVVTLPFDSIEMQEVSGKIFLFYKFKYKDIIIYFSRDITNIYDFQKRLILNSLLLCLLFFLIVYIIWVKLAKVTLAPIKENNEKLKEYNHYVAHELKTPLAIIKSNLELWEISSDKKLVNSSKEEVTSMENIVNWLLFLSETSTLHADTKVNLIEFIKNFLQKNNLEKKILLESLEGEIHIKANLFLLERLLKNLCENSLKYWVKESLGHIKVWKKGMMFENEIHKDLKVKNVEKLFEPFYQWDNATSRKGHGLWLAIVKRISEIFRWKAIIEVKNKKFKVSLFFSSN